MELKWGSALLHSAWEDNVMNICTLINTLEKDLITARDCKKIINLQSILSEDRKKAIKTLGKICDKFDTYKEVFDEESKNKSFFHNKEIINEAKCLYEQLKNDTYTTLLRMDF